MSRTSTLRLTLSADEKAEIERRARADGRTTARWVRELALCPAVYIVVRDGAVVAHGQRRPDVDAIVRRSGCVVRVAGTRVAGTREALEKMVVNVGLRRILTDTDTIEALEARLDLQGYALGSLVNAAAELLLALEDNEATPGEIGALRDQLRVVLENRRRGTLTNLKPRDEP